MTTANELIEVLSRRHEILRSLDDTPKERHVLVDYLDASKSTIYKGISQLQEQNLIESTNNGLQPTLFGKLALRQYDELARTADLGDLLQSLPPDTIHPSALVGAETVTPDNRAVNRHLARIETMLQEAEAIRGFSPAVSPEYLSVLHQRIIDDGLTVDLVLTEEIVSYLREEYPAISSDLLSTSDVALFWTENELPFTLLLISTSEKTRVCIELGENGNATGLILNDSAESLRWAKEVYTQHKRLGEQVTI